MDNHIFRSALGGFNRQDVMEYIEKTQKEASENAARLEERAAQLEEQIAQLRESGDAARQSLEECAQEKEELSKQLTDMTLRYNHAKNNWDAQAAAKESFRADVAQRDETIRELTEESQRRFQRVQELEEQVTAFRGEKEKIAQLELEARDRSAAAVAQAEEEARAMEAKAKEEAQAAVAQAREQAAGIIAEAEARADAIVTEAYTQAEAVRSETEEQVAGTVNQFNALFSSFDVIAGHITNELRKMDVTVAQLPINFNHLRDSLEALLERAKKR